MNALRTLALAALLAHGVAAHAADAVDPALAHARRVLDQAILFDGHNDLAILLREKLGPAPDLSKYDLRSRTSGHTDLARLREGRVGAQFWSVYIPGEAGGNYARTQLEQIAIARRFIEYYPDAFVLASTADDVERAHRSKKIASMLGMEGGYALENSIALLQTYYDLGVRYMGLTHNTHLDWADSALQVPARHGGLTDFGRSVVREMNRVGMLVDLAHASEKTMLDALDVAEAPVIFSHADARGLVDSPRNVTDRVLDRVKTNGGVVMISFVAGFVSKDAANAMTPAMTEFSLRAREAKSEAERDALRKEIFSKMRMPTTSIAMVADHVDYVAKRIGVDHVGIGSDFDGNDYWPEGLSDTSMYPNLFAELVRRGWKDADLKKLAGGNVIRVLREAEKVSARLKKQYPAPRPPVTASAALMTAVADAARPADDRDADARRKPADMLAFAAMKPGDKVADLIPGRGYFTRLFSATVGANGKVYAVASPRRPNAPAGSPDPAAPVQALAADAHYGNVQVVVARVTDFTLPEPVDVIWTSQNYHDFHNVPNVDMAAINRRIFDSLKPGGTFIVLDHSAKAGSGFADTSTLHRIDADAVKAEVVAAGFEFVGSSNALANKDDTRELKVFDEGIRGRTDQFVLKFRRPKQ